MNICKRCHKVLPPDPQLGGAFLRLRDWMWQLAHRLNCPEQ